jgi:hypothetical protein
MKINQLIGLLASVIGLSCVCPSAHADVYTSAHNQGQHGLPPIESSEDAVARIPVLGKIPHSFLIGDGFKFKMTGKELRIDHMADHSRMPVSHRACMFSLNIASPVAFFGTSVEIPLVSAESFHSGLNTSSAGDYVLHFSKDATVDSPTFGFHVSARF